MSTFKNKLKNEIMRPVQTDRSSTFIATIKQSGSDNSKSKYKYNIEFIDENGEKKHKKGVRVRVYGNYNAEGYSDGDEVVVELENNEYTIIAKHVSDYDELKSEFELKSDVFSNFSLDSLPGFIF